MKTCPHGDGKELTLVHISVCEEEEPDDDDDDDDKHTNSAVKCTYKGTTSEIQVLLPDSTAVKSFL